LKGLSIKLPTRNIPKKLTKDNQKQFQLNQFSVNEIGVNKNSLSKGNSNFSKEINPTNTNTISNLKKLPSFKNTNQVKIDKIEEKFKRFNTDGNLNQSEDDDILIYTKDNEFELKNILSASFENPCIVNNEKFEKTIQNERMFPTKSAQIPFEYLTEIFQNLHQEELVIKVHSYIPKQTEINEKMRAIIVNWMIEVHFKFKLFQETLFLAVNLVDRYLSQKSIKKNKLQLLGVVSLLVACKYEEIFSPEIRDFVCILDKSYQQEDILAMEKDLLKVLQFNITIASSLKFFEILSIKYNLSKKEFFYGNFLLEMCLLDYKLTQCEPSLVSSTVIYMILKLTENKNLLTLEKFKELINYNLDQIRECAMSVCFLIDNVYTSDYQSVVKKYKNKQFLEVSNINLSVK
jgi:hypothetical protein